MGLPSGFGGGDNRTRLDCLVAAGIDRVWGSRHNIYKRPESHIHVTGDDFPLGNLKFVPKEGGKKKTAPPTDKSKKHAPAKQPKPVKENTIKPTPKKKISNDMYKPKKKSTTDKYIFQRHIPTTEEASIRPSAQPQDDTSANIVCDTPYPADAETGAGAHTDKTNSEGDTEILNVDEEQGKDVSNRVDLKEKTAELDECHAGSDPGKTPKSQPPPEHVLMEEDQAGPNPGQSHVALAGPNPEPMHDDFVATVYPQVHESLKHTTEEHVHLENPLSSSGTLSSMKNLEDNFTLSDQFDNDKPTEEDPRKTNVETRVESMVTVPVHQSFSSVPPLSTHVIDLTPPKPISSTIQEPVFIATPATTTLLLPPPPQQHSTIDPALASRVSSLEKVCANFEKRHKLQDKIVQGLSTRVLTLKLRDLPHKIDQTVNEPIDDVPIPTDVHISDSKDIGRSLNDLPKLENNWANALAKSYQYPEENKLLQKTGDMGSFIKWYCKQIGKKKLSKANLEDPAFKVDLMNLEGNQVVRDVSKPLSLRGLLSQVTIQAHYFFNRDLEYLVSCDKERRHALLISKMKVAYYPDFGLEELVPLL
nr:hypothetical protein [Tanacetum cinerariifolium]